MRMLADAPGAAKLKITAAKQERICMGQPGFAGKRPSAPAYLYGQSGFCKPSLNGHVEGNVRFRGRSRHSLRDGMPLLTLSGHGVDAFAAMHGPDLLYLARDPWPWGKPHEAAGLHHASWQRCSHMAARGARAAATETADHRIPCLGHAFLPWPMGGRVCTATTRIRLDRGSHRRHRISLGGGSH